jgi:hypothetical protein
LTVKVLQKRYLLVKHQAPEMILKRAKIEDLRLYLEMETPDDQILENNHYHRQAQSVRRGQPAKLHEGAEVVWSFQVHPYQWKRFKHEHPGISRALRSTDYLIRERAAAQIAAMHPEWIASAPPARVFTG